MFVKCFVSGVNSTSSYKLIVAIDWTPVVGCQRFLCGMVLFTRTQPPRHYCHYFDCSVSLSFGDSRFWASRSSGSHISVSIIHHDSKTLVES